MLIKMLFILFSMGFHCAAIKWLPDLSFSFSKNNSKQNVLEVELLDTDEQALASSNEEEQSLSDRRAEDLSDKEALEKQDTGKVLKMVSTSKKAFTSRTKTELRNNKNYKTYFEKLDRSDLLYSKNGYLLSNVETHNVRNNYQSYIADAAGTFASSPVVKASNKNTIRSGGGVKGKLSTDSNSGGNAWGSQYPVANKTTKEDTPKEAPGPLPSGLNELASTKDLDFKSMAVFKGWDHLKLEGAIVALGGKELRGPELYLRWYGFQAPKDMKIDSYRVYRSEDKTEKGDLLTETNKNFVILSDEALRKDGTKFYYSIIPLSMGEELKVLKSPDISIDVVAPPANRVFIHRWIVNKNICQMMNRKIDRRRYYSCNYFGPGSISGRYDLGKNYIVNRFEAGGTNVEALHMPGQAPWTEITQYEAEEFCEKTSIQTDNGEIYGQLLSRKLQLPIAMWDEFLLKSQDINIQDLEQGRGEGSCNTNSGKKVNTGSADTKNCISAFGLQDMVGNVSEWLSDQIKDAVGIKGLAGNKDWEGFDFAKNGALGKGELYPNNPPSLSSCGIEGAEYTYCSDIFASFLQIILPLAIPVKQSVVDGCIKSFSLNSAYAIRMEKRICGAVAGDFYKTIVDKAKPGIFTLYLHVHSDRNNMKAIGFRCAYPIQ